LIIADDVSVIIGNGNIRPLASIAGAHIRIDKPAASETSMKPVSETAMKTAAAKTAAVEASVSISGTEIRVRTTAGTFIVLEPDYSDYPMRR
jgi:hypothetical protein